jgi:hypothetical protein
VAAPDRSVGRQFAIGATIGAAVLLLFGLVFAASGAAGPSAPQDRYANPAGAVYHAPGPVPDAAQLAGQAVAATLGADGVQTASLVLNEQTSAYNPAAIKVKKGVPVRIRLSSTGGGRDCRSVVDIPALGARGFIGGSGARTMDFTPTQAGVFEFNCPMRMVSPAYLVVTN